MKTHLKEKKENEVKSKKQNKRKKIGREDNKEKNINSIKKL